MWVFSLCVHLYTMCVPDTFGGQKKGWLSWDWMVVSHHRDAKN